MSKIKLVGNVRGEWGAIKKKSEMTAANNILGLGMGFKYCVKGGGRGQGILDEFANKLRMPFLMIGVGGGMPKIINK
jgi:hypothetical protein